MVLNNTISTSQVEGQHPLPVGVQSTQHMRVYYCFLAKTTKQVRNKEDTDELMQILLKSRITTETEIPKEDHVLSIDDVKFFARGDLHAIKAKQKQGKTTALKVILGALTNGELFKLKSQIEDCHILYFDTEQSIRDAKQILIDVQNMTGVSDEYLRHHVALFSLRCCDQELLRKLLTYSLKKWRPEVMIIDGIVEMVVSFNDEAESKALIHQLLSLAEEYHCAIICVLHTNKNPEDRNMRGHLGTMLAQKSATVLECHKNGDIITVCCSEARHEEIPSWSIRYDEDGCIQAADTLQEELSRKVKDDIARRRQEEAQHKRNERLEVCKHLIEEAGGSILRKNLTSQMMEALKMGHSTASAIIKKELEEGTDLMEVNGLIQASPE